ncbi:hypothetical protein HDU98_001151 [Podochytrium sp. JEL0797]|nr:hypothetical protein HDU98_001151 [Podochytrium sp. JEL0797]
MPATSTTNSLIASLAAKCARNTANPNSPETAAILAEIEAAVRTQPLDLSSDSLLALLGPLVHLSGLGVAASKLAEPWRALLKVLAECIPPNAMLHGMNSLLSTRESLAEKSNAFAFLHSLAQLYDPSTTAVTVGLDDGLSELCGFLIVPLVYLNDLKTLAETEPRNQVKAFQHSSGLVLDILAKFASLLDEKTKLKEETIATLLTPIAAFLGCQISTPPRWATAPSHQAAHSLLASLLTQTSTPLIQTLVSKHAKRILEGAVKPYFQKSYRDPAAERKKGLGKEPKQKRVGEGFENQAWKCERVECVEVFEWVVSNVKDPEMSQIQHLVVPTVLTLMDDYDPRYKAWGVSILRTCVLANLSRSEIRGSGLGDVFFETLRVGLTYHSSPPVLRETFQTITLLSCMLEEKGSAKEFSKLSIVMEEGVVRGLGLSIGGKIEIIRIVLESIPGLIEEMGIMTIKYLQPLIQLTCQILQLHHQDTPTQLTCCRAVQAILDACRPRIGVYRGLILRTCADVWMNMGREEEVERRDGRLKREEDTKNRAELRKEVQSIVQQMIAICGDEMKADVDALMNLDPVLFGGMFPSS